MIWEKNVLFQNVYFFIIYFLVASYPPDKTQPASLLNDFKDIPGKACLKGADNNDAFVNVGN